MSKRRISTRDENDDDVDLRQSIVLTQLRAKWAPSTMHETPDDEEWEARDGGGGHRSIDIVRTDDEDEEAAETVEEDVAVVEEQGGSPVVIEAPAPAAHKQTDRGHGAQAERT